MSGIRLVVAFAFCLALSASAAFQVARDGRPAAKIVVSAGADPCVAHAGEELQRWIGQLSGARLEIVEKSDGKIPCIVLAVSPGGYDADLKALAGTDGYAVRRAGKDIVLLGSCPKGVLNGIYKLLYRNTDIIWARPNTEFGTCFTKNANLSLAETDYRDVPAYVMRGWHSGQAYDDFDAWQMANGSNWTCKSMHYLPEYAKYGVVSEYGGGHNLCGLYMREEKYFDQHPEYFPLRDGRRVRNSEFRGGVQLCFTNPELTAAFIKELDAHIANHPEQDTFRVLIEDSYNLCECPECVKTITLDDGTRVPYEDQAFRSTQFYLWLNILARHVRATSGKQLYTYAYFFTEPAPKCKVEDNIQVCLCPIFRNSKFAVDHPVNKRTCDTLHAWTKKCANIVWRDYYGLCGAFPRPIDCIAAVDLVYAGKLGVKRTYTEMRTDRGENALSWDVNSMYFWALAQICWNPAVDVKALRMEFLTRVYGKAAPCVRDFYAVIENSWFKVPGDSRWNDKVRPNWKFHVVKTGIVDACRAHLARAAELVDKPNGKIMLERMRKVFEDNVNNFTEEKIESPHVAAPPIFDPEFKTAPWVNAPSTSNFLTANGKKPTQNTRLMLLHDDENLYLGAQCEAPQLIHDDKKPLARDEWTKGKEKIEIFFSGLNQDGKPVSCQIAITPDGDIYDSMDKDAEWNASFEMKLSKRSKSWSAFVTIPYTTLGYRGQPEKLSFGCLRYIRTDKRTVSPLFWNDTAPHNLAAFSDVILLPKK